MALRQLCLVSLLLALAMVAESFSSFGKADLSLSHLSSNGDGGLSALGTCHGRVGDCINADEENMLDSEASRRALAQGRRYISYAALKKNSIPCNRRGASYYSNCVHRQRANPYNRGCSKITHCYRYTNI